ncbi:MAG: hypothetical protein HY293_04200 [Planctomycetes bacterium]|nr:hypothetical protein [Planctomycetota bacterium]
MRTLWSALAGVYARWKFVEEVEAAAPAASRRKTSESPAEEIARLRQAIAREQRNLEYFRRFDCAALAGPCASSIRVMETRIQALEMSA